MKEKVIIIGAGFAGLAAANELQSHGYEVLILEARDRIGGRAYTDFSLGFPFELGAAVVHGEGENPIAALAEKFQADPIPFDFSGAFFVEDHKTISHLPFEQISPLFYGILSKAKAYAEKQPKDISLLEALKHLAFSPSVLFEGCEYFPWLLSHFSAYMGISADKISARYWDQETTFPGRNLLLRKGFSAIISGLAKDLDIRCKTEVLKIIQKNKKIVCEASQGHFEAEKILITVPLGALKREEIQFSPALPSWKMQAIQNMQMGFLDKLVLKFPYIFWPKEVQLFGRFCEPLFPFPIMVNNACRLDAPILLMFFTHEASVAFEKMSEEAVVGENMTYLKKMFGQDIPPPVASYFTRWGLEKYTYGAYSYPAIGSTPEDFDLLAKPVDSLYFAGEATSKDHLGTTHGAYLSGIRAAKEMLETLR